MRKESVRQEKRPVISDATSQGSKDIVHPVVRLLSSRRIATLQPVSSDKGCPESANLCGGQRSVSNLHIPVFPR